VKCFYWYVRPSSEPTAAEGLKYLACCCSSVVVLFHTRLQLTTPSRALNFQHAQLHELYALHEFHWAFAHLPVYDCQIYAYWPADAGCIRPTHYFPNRQQYLARGLDSNRHLVCGLHHFNGLSLTWMIGILLMLPNKSPILLAGFCFVTTICPTLTVSLLWTFS